MLSFTAIITLILSALGLYILKLSFFPQKRHSLPPGPKPKPLIGNLLDLPKTGELEYMHWLKHKSLYGPISSVTIMGQVLIILNDAQLAYELLEKRSLKHSSRPSQVFAGEMVGWENSLAFNIYSNRFRAHRKQMAQVLGSKAAVSRFDVLQEVEVGRFLLQTLNEPEKLLENFRREAGAVILKIAYGYTIEQQKSDPLVELAGKSLDEFAKAAVPGKWMVDVLPFLRYLPEWFPGTGFKRTARRWRDTLTELTERPFAFVKHQMAQGKHETSFLSQLLEPGNLDEEETFVAKWSALSLYSGGADTTVSSMSCFFLAMTLFPEVQRKAQEEIDRIVGTDKFPGFQDRQKLPYVDAIVKEVLRWHPVAPMGIPHMTTEDDACEGYVMPKGAILLPNIWFFCHDPDVYHDPMSFKPERFLSIDGSVPEPDPHKLSFGFGRRICPGHFLADASLFLNIAQFLAVYRVSKVVEDGKVLEPSANFLPGVISHPVLFRTSVLPRSKQHEARIRAIEQIHPWQRSDAEVLEGVTY